MHLDSIKNTISLIGNSRFMRAYFILWLMASYLVGRLYFMQLGVDFKYWQTDLTAVGALGYVILSFQIYKLLIK